jgi:hypothetical protein
LRRDTRGEGYMINVFPLSNSNRTRDHVWL